MGWATINFSKITVLHRGC